MTRGNHDDQTGLGDDRGDRSRPEPAESDAFKPGSAGAAVEVRDSGQLGREPGDQPPGSKSRLRSWSGFFLLAAALGLVAVPVLGLAASLGGTHLQQALLAGCVVWPLVLLSYLPMLVPTNSPTVLVPMYLAIMIRMFGTLGLAIVVRQIAAPLAPDSWFLYISAFYLAGLVAETSLVAVSLKRY